MSYTTTPSQRFIAGTNIPDTPMTQKLAATGVFGGGKPVGEAVGGGNIMAYPVFGTGGSRSGPENRGFFASADKYVNDYEVGKGPSSSAVRVASLYAPKYISADSGLGKFLGQTGDRSLVSGPRFFSDTGNIISSVSSPAERYFGNQTFPGAKAGNIVFGGISDVGHELKYKPVSTGTRYVAEYGILRGAGMAVGSYTKLAGRVGGVAAAQNVETALKYTGVGAIALTEWGKPARQIISDTPDIIVGGVGFSQGFRSTNPPPKVTFEPLTNAREKGLTYGSDGSYFSRAGAQPMRVTIEAYGQKTTSIELMQSEIVGRPGSSLQQARGQVPVEYRSGINYAIGEKNFVTSTAAKGVYQFPEGESPGVLSLRSGKQVSETLISPSAVEITGAGLRSRSFLYRTNEYTARSNVALDRVTEGVFRQDTVSFRQPTVDVNPNKPFSPFFESPFKGLRSSPFELTAMRGRTGATLKTKANVVFYEPRSSTRGFQNLAQNDLYADTFRTRARRVVNRAKEGTNDALFKSNGMVYANVPFSPQTTVVEPSGRFTELLETRRPRFQTDVLPSTTMVPGASGVFFSSQRFVTPRLSLGGSSQQRLLNPPALSVAQSSRSEFSPPQFKPAFQQGTTPSFSIVLSTQEIPQVPTPTVNVPGPAGPGGPATPEPPVLPFPGLPRPPTFGRGGGFDKASRRGRNAFKYVPDVTSVVYGIHGAQPRGPLVSPATIRPLSLPRKMKKVRLSR